MRIALAQVNSTVGALEANTALVIEKMRAAEAAGADIVAFPELVISGYPPEDLLLKDHFLSGCRDALQQVAAANERACALVGVPLAQGGSVYNAAAVVRGGRIAGEYHKICLPNYAVFDEKRYFTPGDRTGIVDFEGVHIGLNICEDIWEPCGPTVVAARDGDARVVINLSMSPYHLGKGREREAMLASSGAGLRLLRGLRQRRGRPGRVGVRRPEPGVRAGRVVGGQGAAVRRAASHRRLGLGGAATGCGAGTRAPMCGQLRLAAGHHHCRPAAGRGRPGDTRRGRRRRAAGFERGRAAHRRRRGPGLRLPERGGRGL